MLEGSNAPETLNTNAKSWMIKDAGEVPFLLSGTHVREGEQTGSICTFENPDAPSPTISSALIDLLMRGLKPFVSARCRGGLPVNGTDCRTRKNANGGITRVVCMT